MLLIALSACSCASSLSFHKEITTGDPCAATHRLVQRKLDEAVAMFLEEFERLQARGPETREVRRAILFYSGRNFPESDIGKLEPLFRMGCEDPDPEVRDLALVCVIEYYGKSGIHLLEKYLKNASPETRAELLEFMEKHKAKPEPEH